MMTNRREEIKNENRKAIPLFIILLLAAGLTGAVLGVLSIRIGVMERPDIFGSDMTEHIVFGLMIFVAACCQAGGWHSYFRCRDLLKGWDGDDDRVPEQIERSMGLSMWADSVNLILSFACFAILITSLFQDMRLGYSMITVAVFLLNMFALVLMQQKQVDLLKEMNPEKRGSVYDVRFTQKWMESCDEAEKMRIYQSSWAAYRWMNTLFPFAWLVTYFANVFFHVGVFSILLVSVLWLIQTSIYCYKSIPSGR